MAQRQKSFHLSIPAANGDDRYERRPALDGVLDGAHRPRDRFYVGDVWCSEQDKDAQIDSVLRKQARGRIELGEIQALVQVRGRDRMNRLEPHGDFESPTDLSSKREGLGTDSVGVRLDGDSGERRRQRRNSEEIL